MTINDCTKCNKPKSFTLEFFPAYKKGSDKLRPKCRICIAADQNITYNKNKETIDKRNHEKRFKSLPDQRATKWLINGQEPINKQCRGLCGLVRPVLEFHVRGLKKNGNKMYRSICRHCQSEWTKQDKINKSEIYKARRKIYCQKEREIKG